MKKLLIKIYIWCKLKLGIKMTSKELADKSAVATKELFSSLKSVLVADPKRENESEILLHFGITKLLVVAHTLYSSEKLCANTYILEREQYPNYTLRHLPQMCICNNLKGGKWMFSINGITIDLPNEYLTALENALIKHS